MKQTDLAGVLAALSGISILVAGFFQQISVGFGGSPTYLKPWVKFGLYPTMILAQAVVVVLLLTA